MADKNNAITGGEFLIRETQAHDIFIPEEFSDEQLMMRQTCQDFVSQEIHTKLDAIDHCPDCAILRSPRLGQPDAAGEASTTGHRRSCPWSVS